MPPRTQARPFTPLELEIMNILWDHGPSTVAEVIPYMPGKPAYTTVMTMLSVLLRKGRVTRQPEGRAYRYTAAVSRRKAHGSTLSDLIQRMFGGSAEALVLSLVETRSLTAADLDRLSRHVAAAAAEPPAKAPTPRRTRTQEPR